MPAPSPPFMALRTYGFLRIGMLAGEMEMYQWLRPAAAQASGLEPPPPLMPAADARIDLTLAQ